MRPRTIVDYATGQVSRTKIPPFMLEIADGQG